MVKWQVKILGTPPHLSVRLKVNTFMEIGMAVAFAGLFMRIILVNLTKAPLSPVNHPFLDESNPDRSPFAKFKSSLTNISVIA